MMHRPIFPEHWSFSNYITGNVIGETAVPFFFMASSYFLFKKIDVAKPDAQKVVFNTLKRLFFLYLIWSVIYIPCTFVKNHTGHYDEITLKMLLGQILYEIKDFFLSTSFIHLWYVNTLIVSIFLVYWLLKKLSAQKVVVICTVISVLTFTLENLSVSYNFSPAVLFTTYCPMVLSQTFKVGLLCVSLGALIANCNLEPITRKSRLLLCICVILLLTFGVISYYNRNSVFSLMKNELAFLTAFLIFIICINSNMTSKPFYKSLRNYNTLIYFSHLLIMTEGYRYIAFITGIDAIYSNNPLKYVLTFIFASVFSILVLYLSKKESFKWLKRLY